MLYKTLRIVATLALVALTSCDAATRTTAPPSNNSMSVGDGTNVNSTTSTTVFLGTEYNANRCVLQFASLDCLSSTKTNRCGELNGYPLECVDVGNLNGKEKRTCQCRANETDWCQNSTAPTITGGYQFDSCSDSKPCADTYGHVPTKLELRVCAEKLHCVKEVNTTASQPAQICHTCRSCIAQNDAQGAQLTDKRRFDCTKICPKEVLDSIAKRNKNKVGIADEVSSESDSGSGEDSAAADKNSSAGSSGSKKATDKSLATTVPTVSAATVVVSIVVTALSVVLLQ